MVQQKRNNLSLKTILERLIPDGNVSSGGRGNAKDDSDEDGDEDKDDDDDHEVEDGVVTGGQENVKVREAVNTNSIFYNEQQLRQVAPELLRTANKNWLLGTALRCNKITPEEYLASLEKHHVTVKRYLRTVVDPIKDSAMLNTIDIYVQMMSKIRAAGSRLLNMVAIRDYEAGLLSVKKTFLNQTFVKWALLPFKGEVSGVRPTTVPTMRFPRLAEAWEDYKTLLRPTYPPLEDLTRVAWDQSLTDAAREYIGAFEAHIKTHFASRVINMVRMHLLERLHVKVYKDRATGRAMGHLNECCFFMADVYATLEKPCTAQQPIHPDVLSFVEATRRRAGLGPTAKLSKAKLTDAMFKMHIEMSRELEQRGLKAYSACPVIKTQRSFAYLDKRVVEGLVSRFGLRPSNGTADWRVTLGIDRASWAAASKKARSAKRQHASDVRRGLCGAPKYPKAIAKQEWSASSASTDGVAICVTLKCSMDPKPPCMDNTSAVKKQQLVAAGYEEVVQNFMRRNELVPQDVHCIAEDPGRVTMSQAAQKTRNGDFVHSRLTRQQYRRWTLETRRQEAEVARRRANPLLRIALDHLSEHSWRTTRLDKLIQMADVARTTDYILTTEYVEDTWYAQWRMLLWRRRRIVMMQYYASLVRKVAAKGKPVVFGVGDGGFASTGRGETSVPTKSKFACLCRVASCLRDVAPILVTKADERCTTMKCHGCQEELQDIQRNNDAGNRETLRGLKYCPRCLAGAGDGYRVVEGAAATVEGAVEMREEGGQVVRGLLLCIRGKDEIHTGRVRNRDRNASRNIWEVVVAMVAGLPRPEYLCMSKRKQRARKKAPPPPG